MFRRLLIRRIKYRFRNLEIFLSAVATITRPLSATSGPIARCPIVNDLDRDLSVFARLKRCAQRSGQVVPDDFFSFAVLFPHVDETAGRTAFFILELIVRISFKNKEYKVSKAFYGQYAALRPTAQDEIVDVFFCNPKIAQIDL